MDLGGWLRSLGLEEYEAAFHKNHIDEAVLPNLTAEDLKDLGVGSIGHRRKLLDAIALLRGDGEAKAKAPPPETPSVHMAIRKRMRMTPSGLCASAQIACSAPSDMRISIGHLRCAGCGGLIKMTTNFI